MGKTGRLHENSSVQATVLGPMPLKLARNSLASSSGAVARNERSSEPRRSKISLSRFFILSDFCRASPPERMAASMDVARARRAFSHVGNRCFKFSKARSLFTLVVDCESMVSISSSSGSRLGSGEGTP